MSDDDPERPHPAGPTGSSFEVVTAAPPANADPFSKLSPELRERIRRQGEEKRRLDADTANKDEDEFWLEVPFRKPKLEAMKVLAQNVDAPDAVALAMRNAMLFHIDEAIDALPKDEEEVRSALPAELKATIERVRRRWKECDKRAAGMSIIEQTPGLDGLPQAPAGVDAQPAEAQTSARQPAYSPEALAAWFVLRVFAWPKDVRPPTEGQCRKAASDFFEGSIPRDEFRKIRIAKTPANWRKAGPPSGR
jgi:hypothetical protein